MIQVESHTKLKLLNGPRSEEVAGEEFGRYSRADAAPYLGSFTFARPSFRQPDVIDAFATEIVWDDGPPCLAVHVRDTTVPVQLGRVYMPRGTLHLFVLSVEQAWLKQLILSHLAARTMKGVMLTMGPVFCNVYSPVGMPVFMLKRDAIDEAEHGEIAPGHASYEEYRHILLSVETENFARWIGVPKG